MLKKCLLVLGMSALSTVSLDAAAVVTCSQPGSSETVYNGVCTVGSGVDSLQYHGISESSVSGNIFTVEALAEIIALPETSAGRYPMSGSATWDDIFEVPGSNPSDIYEITVSGGGFNHPASISVGSILYTTPDFCDLHYVGNPVCTATETVSANMPLSVHVTGSDSATVPYACGASNCGFGLNADLYEYVTVEQFLADGVTPDPFTTVPEPSSFALIVLAVPGALALRRRLR